jgi:predicted SAM-dependent methyltransferase
VRTALKGLAAEIVAEARRGARLRHVASGKTGLRLNIGCGSNVIDGWLNVDAYVIDKDVLHYNALNCLPLDNGSVKRIHCEHFLEHLDLQQAMVFLVECRRVLEVEGTMRIIVPDAEKYMTSYVARDEGFFGQLRFLGNASRPLETNMMVCDQMFRMGGDHCSAWDFITIEKVCRGAGFSSVERSEWRGGPVEHQIDGLDNWRPLESLYCELRA